MELVIIYILINVCAIWVSLLVAHNRLDKMENKKGSN